MTESKIPRPAILPFLLGDLLLLAAAGGIVYQSTWPLSLGHMALCTAAVAVGAWLMVTPFIMQYRAELKLAEADKLSSTVAQIQHLEQIKTQIAEATGLWQNIQGECARTVNTAKEVADGMAAEAKSFTDFLQKANDSEKATLRLEVDKLRRMESEWLQVLVRTLDHVYALYMAGVQSGQANLIEQLAHFQNACRDVARRVGLVPFIAETGEVFDPQMHQLADPNAPADPAAGIAQTIATGYRYQGQLIRPAIVILAAAPLESPVEQFSDSTAATDPLSEPQSSNAAAGEPSEPANPSPTQPDLPM